MVLVLKGYPPRKCLYMPHEVFFALLWLQTSVSYLRVPGYKWHFRCPTITRITVRIFPARIFLVIFHCTMPDAHVVDIFMTQHPTSAANIPSFSIGSARFGESVEPVIFAVTRDFFVEVCHCGDRENSTSWGNIWEEDGRWDQVEQIKYRTFFRWSWRSRAGMMYLVIVKWGSICQIESVNLPPRTPRCSAFNAGRFATTIRRDPSLPRLKVGATLGIPLGLFHGGHTLADPKLSWNWRKRHVLLW